MKVKIFMGEVQEIEKNLNDWLRKNDSITTVSHVKQTVLNLPDSHGGNTLHFAISIWYDVAGEGGIAIGN